MVDHPELHPLRIFPRAEADLASAFDHYEDQEAGLGFDFLRAFETALLMLRRHPSAAPKVAATVRRVMLRRFPYGVFYDERDGTVRVLAVLHARRNPGIWPGRPKG